MPSDPRSVRFGEDLELDPRAYQLRRGGAPLKLERIPLEILLFLVEHRGELVSREQIAERIWGKNTFLDVDNSINGAIRKIRQVLRDDSDQPRFIETVTGLGYRFIAPLQEREPEPAAPAAPSSPGPVWWRRLETWLFAAGTAFVLLALGVAARNVWTRSRASAGDARVMLAVLPFQNLTGDPRQEYFSDGLTEETITQLGNRDPARLGVIARTSVMQYKTGAPSLGQIARELGVQYVLTGSVRRDVNRVRVAAQLVRTRDQTQLWAQQYDRRPEGLLTLQGEIAQEIADAIQTSLGGRPPAEAQPVASAHQFEAYDLYLRGQYAFNQRGIPDLEAAVRYFQQATDKDSTYARAYAALADSYVLLVAYSGRPSPELVARAREAAAQALQLDPSLPEAHTALALIVQNYDWDWRTADEEFRRAIALNPNYATAHHWYAEHLMWQGRFAAALAESERARQLDPLSLIIAADNGAILFFSRQYDRAIEKWRSVLDINPEFQRALIIIYAYVEKGQYDTAAAFLERHRGKLSAGGYWSTRAFILGRAGRMAQAREAIGEVLREREGQPLQAIAIAQAFTGIGDKQRALDWLDRAYAERANELTTLKVSPAFDPLRGEPRFQRLLERVGLGR